MNKLVILLLFCSISFAEETRIKIAVIDTGIQKTIENTKFFCQTEHDLTGEGIQDFLGHGTNIAGIIAKYINPKTHCILVIKYYAKTPSNSTVLDLIIKSFEIAVKEQVKYINLSSGGPGKNDKEHAAIKNALDKNITVVVAAGNENTNLLKDCDYYPACYNFTSNKFKVVGNGKSEKEKTYSSNFGTPPITDWKYGVNQNGFGFVMTGTSQSTAIKTGEIVKDAN
ncbi:MAG: S8 family serine peptidase [Richelia sp. RM2_1_2]|nr:S8 family serine peptidase [Richelia sp. RM2_1_2]